MMGIIQKKFTQGNLGAKCSWTSLSGDGSVEFLIQEKYLGK